MPELCDQMYCSQQIIIPPKFPYILKKFCKAAIKTQPYDLLRWSFEYFKALAEHRPPPVKLRLEYPIYSTEGGLTRGCLKVLAQQLIAIKDVPLPLVKQVWQGFCLDPLELKRIFCLCEVYKRADTVPYLYFLAVAGGMLTKCLTHTMILLCESLTKEPDGGSAAIPMADFLSMYLFLAAIDASSDVKYYNGYREGQFPEPEESIIEEQTITTEDEGGSSSDEEFWQGATAFTRLQVTADKVAKTARLSTRVALPLIGKIERSPSVERAGQIERDNYMSDKKGRAMPNADVERRLKQLSSMQMEHAEGEEDEKGKGKEDKDAKKEVTIALFNEDLVEIEYSIFGEPEEEIAPLEQEIGGEEEVQEVAEEKESEEERIAFLIAEIKRTKEERYEDLERSFDEIAAIVNRFKSANYDLGMVAGRQMSTTSGEFIVQHIEKEIMDYINEQIAILPDPDLKKKKAKPEEVEMIRQILETFLDENMATIIPEIEEVEEEEAPIPEVTVVYAVPGIGPIVSADIINDFVEYIREVSKVQEEVVMPRNLRHYLCPPLEKYAEYKYDEASAKLGKKEEVPLGGVLIN